jgi:hypothetical protein
MRVRPVTPDVLVDELASAVSSIDRQWVRVAVDGAPSTVPGSVAGALVEALRVRGRFALLVPAEGFWKAASLRLERGRTNPDGFYEDWLDLGGLSREVLSRVAPGGDGRVLPSLWDVDTDRATRAAYVRVPPGGVVVVSGALLLGAGLDFDFTVHLAQTAAALARRTEPAWAWTLPAFERYSSEVMPELLADVVVRVDDPRHPAVVDA